MQIGGNTEKGVFDHAMNGNLDGPAKINSIKNIELQV